VALLFVPLLAAGMLGAVGLRGILLIDLASYAVAIAALAVLRFPDMMGHRRRETFGEQLLGRVRLTWGTPAFRAMLVFYGIGNLLYAVPVLLVTPQVLAFAGIGQVGQVALADSGRVGQRGDRNPRRARRQPNRPVRDGRQWTVRSRIHPAVTSAIPAFG
jgi:multisubunit Na+/H+ antiporter MnhG subunit